MKIQIFSDIHLEHYYSCQVFPFLSGGDLLILAGDILCAKHFCSNGHLKSVYQRFLDDCSKKYKKILYVFGNHESYGYNYEGSFKKIKEHLPDNFHLMENDTVQIDNWNFIGFTFWTDFRNENPLEMMEAECQLNDYKKIRIKSTYRKLNANDTLGFHKVSKRYLIDQLKDIKKNVFVISHHAPSYQSIAQEFKKYSSAAYVSDLDNLILSHPQIKYWVHGHTHTPFNYMIGDCRVICNPCGYPDQDTKFDKELFFTI